MKSLLVSVVLLIASAASAHIEKGTWKGVVSENANCFMDVGDQTYLNNMRHPLNERIEITIGHTVYSVGHPYSINAKDGSVAFNHDLFEGVVATPTGAFAVQIKMAHTADFEGPVGFSVMEHNWKAGTKELVVCDQLKKVN